MQPNNQPAPSIEHDQIQALAFLLLINRLINQAAEPSNQQVPIAGENERAIVVRAPRDIVPYRPRRNQTVNNELITFAPRDILLYRSPRNPTMNTRNPTMNNGLIMLALLPALLEAQTIQYFQFLSGAYMMEELFGHSSERDRVRAALTNSAIAEAANVLADFGVTEENGNPGQMT